MNIWLPAVFEDRMGNDWVLVIHHYWTNRCDWLDEISISNTLNHHYVMPTFAYKNKTMNEKNAIILLFSETK